MRLLANMALSPIDDKSVLINTTTRILKVSEAQNLIIIIEVEPRRRSGRFYFTAPFQHQLSHILTEINANSIQVLNNGVRARPDVVASDEALNQKYGQYPCKCVAIRNSRFSVIQSLIADPENYPALFDQQYRNELITKYLATLPNATDSIKQQTQQIVFQFLSQGLTRNGLTPFLSLRGGRGKERLQVNKLGRKNAPTRAGIVSNEGFVMSEKDKEICEFAFRNYLIRGATVDFALRKMWRNFYSEQRQCDNGKITVDLWHQGNRPTRAQFVRWGSKNSNQKIWQKQFNKQQLARLDRALTGKANDGVFAVGQLGSIDSTSTDTEFVSLTNRLKRIGQAYRILLVDCLYGYIPGFYMGLEAASASTVNLALMHAATDKTEWLNMLGLDKEIAPSDWLSIQFGRLIADNTDTRNQRNIEEQNALGIGISYVPTHRSDLNSLVESSHKSLHRLIDHKQPGTTRGKRLERGDTRPDFHARLTLIEGIRESARAIHFHNTFPLNIPISLEIRRELIEKGLTINRLNLTRMAINQGKIHSSIYDHADLMTTLGTPIQGTFTSRGVKLHRPNNMQRAFIENVRYISDDPLMLERFREAKTKRRGSPLNFDAEFFHNPYFPSKIYYRDIHSGRVFALKIDSSDEERDEYTLHDYLFAMEEDALHRYESDDHKQQQLAEQELRLEQTVRYAENEYKSALKNSGPVAKSAISRDKKSNRKEEKRLLSTLGHVQDIDRPRLAHAEPLDQYIPSARHDRTQKNNILDILIGGQA